MDVHFDTHRNTSTLAAHLKMHISKAGIKSCRITSMYFCLYQSEYLSVPTTLANAICCFLTLLQQSIPITFIFNILVCFILVHSGYYYKVVFRVRFLEAIDFLVNPNY